MWIYFKSLFACTKTNICCPRLVCFLFLLICSECWSLSCDWWMLTHFSLRLNGPPTAGKSGQLLPAKERGMLGDADVTGSLQFSFRCGWLQAGRTPRLPLPLRWGNPSTLSWILQQDLRFSSFKVSSLPSPKLIGCRKSPPPHSLPKLPLLSL